MLKKPFFFFVLFLLGISDLNAQQAQHIDLPFIQDYSVKYYFENGEIPQKIFSDRNQNVKILTQTGVMMPYGGQFLYPGKFAQDNTYPTAVNKVVKGMTLVDRQFVFTDEEYVYSQAWAGRIFLKSPIKNAKLIAGSPDFKFLVSDGKSLGFVSENKAQVAGSPSGDILALVYNEAEQAFFVLSQNQVFLYEGDKNALTEIYKTEDITSFDLSRNGETLYIGTKNGLIILDWKQKKSKILIRLPSIHITTVKVINNKVWCGSPVGAFAINIDESIDYYNGERWIPSNHVIHIEAGSENSVLVLTDQGLGRIFFKEMTLEQKARFYEKQVRARHIRNGFNAAFVGMKRGDLSTGYMKDSDNDGLWTSMYLGGQAFRYAVTREAEALENVRESLDAMERLYDINPVSGFPARSFERSGHERHLSDPERWRPAENKEWTWKATTSSDEAIGHMFVFGVIAEVVDVPDIRDKAIMLMDTLMSHIVRNDMYLVDYDGNPTTWGRWNPEYVNRFPANVGDRKLNSSNITGMLQTAYHFTKKEKYKEKILELFEKHGYLENLARPMSVIGETPENGDAYAQMLSEAWNHSDDEMYFLGYWGLYRYALNDKLKQIYKEAILDHWEAERPEKDGLWNIFTAITGVRDFDLDEAVWYLQRHPLDMIQWDIENSHRQDVEKLPDNFRKQTLKEVLPPDERPVQKHNANMFRLDRKGANGISEQSAGDVWLLPYWLGRYLEVIR